MPRLESITLVHPVKAHLQSTYKAKINYVVHNIHLTKGDLIVSTHQENGLLVSLLLDVESIDSLYQYQTFRPLLLVGKNIKIFPVTLYMTKKPVMPA